MRQQLSVSDQRHNQDPATPQTSAIGIPTQPLKTPVGDTLPTSFSNAASGTFAKQAISSSKSFRTDMFLYIRDLTADNKELTGKRRMVVAASWHGFCKTETGALRLESSRGFSPLFMANFENGVATMHQSIFLKLRLVTQDNAAWVDQNDVKIFLYEVVGHYNPPLPEDTFGRLDEHISQFTTSSRMASEEALLGLHLVHSGAVPIKTLIDNRSKPRFDFDEASSNALISNVVIRTSCKMEPYVEHQNHHHAHSAEHVREAYEPLTDPLELKLTSETNRVLRSDSR